MSFMTILIVTLIYFFFGLAGCIGIGWYVSSKTENRAEKYENKA